jgi:phosphoribosylformylglycinamidine synthase PurS subunit
MRYRANVVVRLKDGVLDPQGQTILQAARTLGFRDIRNARVGKQFALDLEARDKAGAKAVLDGLCRKLLSNPVIETYAFEILNRKSGQSRGKR